MMLKSVVNLNPSSSPSLHLESKGVHCPRSSSTICCGLRDYSGIPYIGTFSKPRDTFDDHFEVRNLPVIDIKHSGSGAQNDDGSKSRAAALKEENQKPRVMTAAERAEKLMEERNCPVPDGIPPSWEELEEIERMKMRDSSFTRLLRYIGGYPSWYVPRPDHETD